MIYRPPSFVVGPSDWLDVIACVAEERPVRDNRRSFLAGRLREQMQHWEAHHA